jgi:phenylalanyl-tRNA synthetase beta chain
MRPISNVVDASNLVMLELGQPTHPYDAARVVGRTLRARRARAGETLTTLDGVERSLAVGGRGLGDTGEDCVIVDGQDRVLGLAGVMGGASSEIGPDTTEVLLEAAYFDPMAIARTAKRHGLRSEASNRFERGVDPELALRAVARFVAVLSQSIPELEWLTEPLDVAGRVPTPPTLRLETGDIGRLLGVEVEPAEVRRILEGLDFSVADSVGGLDVTAPSRRLDVREGVPGRADVIEEIARLYGYQRLPRHYPAWPEVGGLTERQRLRRRVRDAVVDLGALEAWTATLISDADFDLLHAGGARVRVTNPLAADESVLRATLLTGLVRAWARNEERGLGDVVLAELGVVFVHPDESRRARATRGGAGGALILALPEENERTTVLLARRDDDATSAVAFAHVLVRRLGLKDVVVRSLEDPPAGLHPTRAAELVDRDTGSRLGYVGEVDATLIEAAGASLAPRRLGVVDLDLDAVVDPARATRTSELVAVPTRFPSAVVDLALVTPDAVNAQDLGHALRVADQLVEDVRLFDVYRGTGLPEGSRSLAYRVRFSSNERTLGEREVATLRDTLIAAAAALGAELR